jgi:hypothetical protein
MTDIIPTAAEAKDLADDCCEALAELLSRPTTTARRPITRRILAEMQKTLSDESWAEAMGSPIKTYLGFNSIHLCMRLLRSHGHLAQAARIEAALEAAAGRLSEDKDDDVDPTINWLTRSASASVGALFIARSPSLLPLVKLDAALITQAKTR